MHVLNPIRPFCCRLLGLALVAGFGLAVLAGPAGGQVRPSDAEWKKLDTFEAHTLGKADEVYWKKKDYKRAAAEYDSFILEFPESRAIAYALLQKARCLHHEEKRFEAIDEYQEVLDYFPNAVKYAAASSYYIGLCHWENGDEEKALVQWAKLARDKDYAKQPLAAGAINKLADYRLKENQADAAVKYYTQVATNFRRANADEARHALGQAMYHHIRRSPNEQKLRELYKLTEGFDHHPRKVEGKPEDDNRYWQVLRDRVWRYGQFSDVQQDLKKKYFGYWAKAVGDRHPKWDDMRIDVARWKRVVDGSREKYVERIDAQFAAGDTKDFGRITKWMVVYKDNKAKWSEYYEKIDFAKMDNGQVIHLMRVLYDQIKDNAMATNAFGHLNLAKMSDNDKRGLAEYLWWKNGKLVERIYASFEDKVRGRYELLRYYHRAGNVDKGLPLADEVIGEPKYAASVIWMKAELLDRNKQYAEAIKVYQQAENQPHNLKRIVDCYVKLGKLEQAVAQLREIEGFFKNDASWASLKIAHLYRNAGKKQQYVAELRALMKKYPGTPQQSDAHNELEKMGIRIGGGMDAE